MKGCDLYLAAEKVACELPEGFELNLNLEAGYGGAELLNHGVVVKLPDFDEESLAEQVLFALKKAKEIDNG